MTNGALLAGQDKIWKSLEELTAFVESVRQTGKRIVLTSGTFDIFHIGHGRYLSQARSFGDILIVGVDSDTKVRARKGETRPRVKEDERVEMLTYLFFVHAVYIKPLKDERWALIRAVRPDVLVVSTRSAYSAEDIQALKEFCGSVEVLAPQAETSTTGLIRTLMLTSLQPLLDDIDSVEQRFNSMKATVNKILGGEK